MFKLQSGQMPIKYSCRNKVKSDSNHLNEATVTQKNHKRTVAHVLLSEIEQARSTQQPDEEPKVYDILFSFWGDVR